MSGIFINTLYWMILPILAKQIHTGHIRFVHKATSDMVLESWKILINIHTYMHSCLLYLKFNLIKLNLECISELTNFHCAIVSGYQKLRS